LRKSQYFPNNQYYSLLTTATAGEDNICSGDNTPRYAILANKYTTITSVMEMKMANGRFLKRIKKQYNAMLT